LVLFRQCFYKIGRACQSRRLADSSCVAVGQP
jgi:hypothetical protein